MVQLARVRYELMIRLIFTLLGERNEYIIRYDEKRKKKGKIESIFYFAETI